MRIGISTSVIQRGKSGVGQYVFGLLRGLLSPSGQHKFILFVLEEDLPLFAFAKDKAELVAVPEKFRPPVRNILWHQMRLPRLVRDLRLDVLHIPSYRRMLRTRPCPIVATIHDLAPFHLAEKYDWMRMFYGRVVARRLARRQDRIIAISEYTAGDIVKFFGLPGGRIAVVHNGVDHERFHPARREKAKADVTQRFKLNQHFFLYVSRLEHPAKNHVRLIAAFEEFKRTTKSNWQLAFGGGDWHGAETIHAAIRKSPFNGDIHCLGFVPDAQLPDLYRAADVLVYPSLHEGFGLPPVEAMHAGAPVIASTAVPSAAGAALEVDPLDVDAIADALAAVSTDHALREDLIGRGRQRAARLTWEAAAGAHVDLWRAVAA
jgi:glycosyltransferase involved in cell wall biosynthesis